MTHPEINDKELKAAGGGFILATIGAAANAIADAWKNEKQTTESLSAIDKLNAMNKNTEELKKIHEAVDEIGKLKNDS